MKKSYAIVKGVYEQYFSEDPKQAAADPFFYMLEQLFFLSYHETTKKNVSAFMETLPFFSNKKRIEEHLFCYVTKANYYPWEDGHSVNG